MNKNSLAAYRSIGSYLDGHYLTIYEALLAGGAQTAWDISVTSEDDYRFLMEPAQVFRRLSELERAKYIQRLDWVKDSPSGRACSVWWVK